MENIDYRIDRALMTGYPEQIRPEPFYDGPDEYDAYERLFDREEIG